MGSLGTGASGLDHYCLRGVGRLRGAHENPPEFVLFSHVRGCVEPSSPETVNIIYILQIDR